MNQSDETPALEQPTVALEYASGQDIGEPVETQEERMFRLRSAYSSAMNDIMDRILSELLVVNDQTAVCLDAAQFFTFLMVTKVVEARGLPITRENLMADFWPFQKALKDEVLPMLRQYAERVAAQAAEK